MSSANETDFALLDLVEWAEVVELAAGQDGFGQPLADVGLAARAGRGELVEAEIRDDLREVGGWFAHRPMVDGLPPQPGILQHLVSLGRRPEHPVGDPEHPPAMPLKDLQSLTHPSIFTGAVFGRRGRRGLPS